MRRDMEEENDALAEVSKALFGEWTTLQLLARGSRRKGTREVGEDELLLLLGDRTSLVVVSDPVGLLEEGQLELLVPEPFQATLCRATLCRATLCDGFDCGKPRHHTDEGAKNQGSRPGFSEKGY